MPKFKGRQTNRGNWNIDNMKRACDAVINGTMGLRQASTSYEVPKSSLSDRVRALRSGQEITMDAKLGRFNQTFSSQYETILCEHVKDLSSRLMPLSRKEFLQLAFQLAEKLKIPHRFNQQKKSAGKDFYQGFMTRHKLALRTPESTSLMRCVGFNRPQVKRFFDSLSLLMQKFNFTPYTIYNCDETAVSTVHKHTKVLSPKGIRQVGKITSAERGKNVTVLFCMSAGAQFIPPFFVFPRARINERLKIGAPLESVAEAQTNGWMNAELFLKWMRHFCKYANPTKERPVLLVLDGHASHKDLNVITFARENNIHMISTPPHTTHKLQPLDRTFMKPFKDALYEACGVWMRRNPGVRISEYEISGLVNTAFTKVSRAAIAQKGFECTGIVPFNPEIFDDLDFMSSEITNVPDHLIPKSQTDPAAVTSTATSTTNLMNLSETTTIQAPILKAPLSASDHSPRQHIGSQTHTLSHHVTADYVPTPQTPPHSPIQRSSPSSVAEKRKLSIPIGANDTINFKNSLESLCPVPDASKKRLESRKRRSEKCEILTSTPYKNALEEKEQTKKGQVKRNIKLDGKGCAKPKKKVSASRVQNCISQPSTSGTSKSGEDVKLAKMTICILCQESFEEDWIQCYKCHSWVHEACADLSETSANYECDFCTKKLAQK